MSWIEVWAICGLSTFAVMAFTDFREGRKFKFIDTESVYGVGLQLFVAVIVFILGPIGLAFTLMELFGGE